MLFEWDENKNRANIANHGYSFEDAIRIFDGSTIDMVDDRFEYDELRTVSIGTTNGITLLVVVHTDRQGVTRIISARRAEKHERRQYERHLQKG